MQRKTTHRAHRNDTHGHTPAPPGGSGGGQPPDGGAPGSAHVIIARPFFDSLCRLGATDQARVNEFIQRFQADPARPGVSLERVQGARSKDVWAARATRDLRVILYKDGATWAILYVNHHEQAYDWAARREIGRNSFTGAFQIVEPVEIVRENVLEFPRRQSPPLFASCSDAYLLSLGVPEIWLPTLRRLRDDTRLLDVCASLPSEVSDRLIDLVVGKRVVPPQPIAADRPATEAADGREFYVVRSAADLDAALKAPMQRWITFLHASQLDLVQRVFSGPARVSGSAGTGKTIVAMHRARHLARQGEKVLLITSATTLAENIARNMDLLCAPSERQAITVSTVYQQARDLVRRVDRGARLASPQEIDRLLHTLGAQHAPLYDAHFIRAEWHRVVRPQGLRSWESYRDARRAARTRTLTVAERKILWKVFGGVIAELDRRNTLDGVGMALRAEALLTQGTVASPCTAVIVDEVQDFSPAQLLFVRALCAQHPGNLMLCGDAGQRVLCGGFSLGALGIDVRGRSTVLKINYRTTEQIRRVADQLLGTSTDDMDGGEEPRGGVKSIRGGPTPVLRGYESPDEELAMAIQQIRAWLAAGHQPGSIGVLTYSHPEKISQALKAASLPWCPISRQDSRRIHVGTMYQARGLELKLVLVLGCSAGVIPDARALRGADDAHERNDVLLRERRLLYVAMTRARDELVVSFSGKPSPFIEPLLRG